MAIATRFCCDYFANFHNQITLELAQFPVTTQGGPRSRPLSAIVRGLYMRLAQGVVGIIWLDLGTWTSAKLDNTSNLFSKFQKSIQASWRSNNFGIFFSKFSWNMKLKMVNIPQPWLTLHCSNGSFSFFCHLVANMASLQCDSLQASYPYVVVTVEVRGIMIYPFWPISL